LQVPKQAVTIYQTILLVRSTTPETVLNVMNQQSLASCSSMIT